jgi:hypothetical protein
MHAPCICFVCLYLKYSAANQKGAATYDAASGQCTPQKTPKTCGGMKVQLSAPEFCSSAESSLGGAVKVQALKQLSLIASEGARGPTNIGMLDISAKERNGLLAVRRERTRLKKSNPRRPLQLQGSAGEGRDAMFKQTTAWSL